MFIGHFGIAYAVKKKEPQLPLYLLFIATQLLDLLAFVFILLGVEKLSYLPNENPFFRNHLELPYSHSLLVAALLSLLVFIGFRARGLKRWAYILSLCVLSHWFVDYIVHTPDLPLLIGKYHVGLGLWKLPYLSFAVELLFVFVTWLMFKERTVFSYILLVLMLLSFTGMLFAPEPDIVKSSGAYRTLVVLVLNGLFIILAYLSDRKTLTMKNT